jgi:hypothetical protein
VVASTGCTPAQAWSEWDLPSLVTQLRYWRRHPPVHLLVAAYLDYKPAAQGGPGGGGMSDATVQALMASAPPMPEHLKARIPRHV